MRKPSPLKGKKVEWQKWEPRPEVLLDAPIPEPMYGMAPRVVLGVNWWNRTRREAYKTTNFCCVACEVYKGDAKSRQWLECHERYEVDYLLGRMTYVGAVPLCHYCHNYVHPGRMRAFLEQNKLTHAKFAAIVQHGDEVLRGAGLRRPDKPPNLVQWAAPEEWRLVIDDAEYDPKDYVKTFVRFSESTKEGGKKR